MTSILSITYPRKESFHKGFNIKPNFLSNVAHKNSGYIISMSKYFQRSTSASQETNQETTAKTLGMMDKPKADIGAGTTEQNITVFRKCRNDGTNEKLPGKRGKVEGKIGLLITSSVISGVKGYHLMLADQLIDV